MAQISIIKKSDISETHRFDAEYFKPGNIKLRNIFSNLKTKPLLNFLQDKIMTGHTPSMSKVNYYGGSIKFIKTDNLRVNHIKPKFNHYLSESGNNLIKRTSLQKNDIIITIIGANEDVVGRVAMIDDQILPANINQNIALVRVKEDKINPYFLNIFLNSKYGRGYLHSLARQTEQVNLNCREVEQLLIPSFKKSFQLQIEEIVKKAHQKQTQSKQLYKEAEQLLLEELGLIDYQPKQRLSFETTKKEIDEAKRFDAEYFQPKYKEIIEKIENYKNGFDVVKNIVNWKKGIEVGTGAYTEQGKEFVRVSDFSIFGIEETSRKISNELFEEIKEEYQPEKGDILFTKDGTIGLTYVLKKNIDGVLSSAFLSLRLKEEYQDFKEECLALVLNSIISKMQIEQLSGGAIIAHLKPSDFEKFKIPLIKSQIQKQIVTKIQKSHKLRREAKELLKLAKREVEEKIENP